MRAVKASVVLIPVLMPMPVAASGAAVPVRRCYAADRLGHHTADVSKLGHARVATTKVYTLGRVGTEPETLRDAD